MFNSLPMLIRNVIVCPPSVFKKQLDFHHLFRTTYVGENGAGWSIKTNLGPHEVISFHKWKINPQTDRVNKYSTLIPNQFWMN